MRMWLLQVAAQQPAVEYRPVQMETLSTAQFFENVDVIQS
jgi:hypothetical protein